MRTFRFAICPHRKIAPILRAGKLLPGLLLLCLLPHDVRSADEPEPEVLLTIVYSADINGYLEPCGCGGVKEGGIARQATLLNQMRGQGPVLAISGGGFGGVPEAVAAMLKGLERMSFDLIYPSAADLEIAPEVIKSAGAMGLVTVPRTDDFSHECVETLSSAGVRVGVLGISRSGASAAVEALLGRCSEWDLLLVLAEAMDEEASDRLARSLGELPLPTVLLAPSGAETNSLVARGDCLIPTVPARGRGVVAIRVWRDVIEAPVRLTVSQEPVHPSLLADAELSAIVSDYYEARRKGLIASPSPIASPSTHSSERATTTALLDATASYAGAEVCGECHTDALSGWRESRHANALATLVTADRLLPECLECHSTEFTYGGTVGGASSSEAGGVECASCHGDGVLHSATRRAQAAVASPNEDLCRSCHTKDDSPGFEFGTYSAELGCAVAQEVTQ